MSSNESSYHLLIRKLDEFIRKYYKNQWLRGLIYSSAIFFLSFLLISVTEYFFYLNSTFRTIIFYTFLLLNFFFLFQFVFRPLSQFYQLGKLINHNQAAQIIGDHFVEIKDKLINTLQLHQLSVEQRDHQNLIEASINQKINQLKPIPFTSAIDLNKNKKYLKYLYFPLSIILIILIAAPSMITESTKRLINHSEYFEKPAPFQYLIQNKSLEVLQGEDLELKIKMIGEEIPQDIYILIDDETYKLEKQSIINFKYALRNLQKTKKIQFFADGFYSKEYEINVIAKPMVMRFDMQLEYPSYLNKKSERIQNNGDLTVPQGTKIKWVFFAENTEKLVFDFGGRKEELLAEQENRFTIQKRAMKNASYSLRATNKFAENPDTVSYFLNVIPDLFPKIDVEQKIDSIRSKLIYFIGNAKDDYGFSRLTFNYRKNKETEEGKVFSFPIAISTNKNSDAFFYYWDVNSIPLEPGEQISYYFELWDNDGVNGSKSVRSEMKLFKAPTEQEISKQTELNNKSLKENMKEAREQAEQIRKEAEKLNEKLLNKKNITFEEKKQIKDLIEKQKQLEQNIDEISKQNKENNIKEQEYKNIDQNILEKKKQLEEMFNNVLDEKTKEMIRELEKLMEQNNKEATQDKLQQMENKDLEKELDRMLELYKQMEFDQKFEESTKKLEELAKKQEELSQESKEKKTDKNELAKKQDELNKKFDEVKKDIDDLEKKNEELENKEDFEKPEQEMSDIDNDMKKSSDNLDKDKKEKASESQKSAADKMNELAKKMKSQQSQGEQEELDLNMKALRELLENLLTVSFDQEKTMEELKKTNTNDPRYLSLTQKQKGLKDDVKMIEDSLFALSKKVVQIQSFVNKELGMINQNMQKSIESLAERRTNEATNRQQYVMTSVNNLAVMLSEVLQQMQQEMMDMKKDGKPGSKKGKKTGKKPGNSLSKMQDELNKQIQQMKDGMKPGQKPGKGEMSQQLAKMAAQQQAIRSALQQMEKEMMGKDGKPGNNPEINQLKKEMEKTETDLYNKNITQETINRQKEIMSRLLETEKAQREREFDNKRESEKGVEQNMNYNIVFEEYKKLKMKELELLKTVPPKLNPYYKNKVNSYFENLNQ